MHEPVLLLLVLLLQAWVVAAAGEDLPNVVVILVDDLGWGDIGYNAADFGRATSNLVEAAEGGVILDTFYTSCVCTPSRASFMTGRYPHRYGLHDGLISLTDPRGLSLSESTLADKLRSQGGYRTSALGKWHLGFVTEAYTPLQRGFDSFFGMYGSAGDHFLHSSAGVAVVRSMGGDPRSVQFKAGDLVDNGQAVDLEEPDVFGIHSTSLYTAKAVEKIRHHGGSASSSSEDPLFLYLAYQAVHSPLEAPAEYSYQNMTDVNGCHDILLTAADDDNDDSYDDAVMRSTLCAMAWMIDTGYAEIEQALKEQGMYDNTLIVFMSDNGGSRMHGSDMGPFRGEKGTLFEGGVRTPAFLAGGHVKKRLAEHGTAPYRQQGMVHITDVHAMIAGLVGLGGVGQSEGQSEGQSGDQQQPQPQPHKLDGIDMLEQLLRGEDSPRSEATLAMNSKNMGYSAAFRKGSFKYMATTRMVNSEIYEYGMSLLQQDGASYTMVDFFAILRTRVFEDMAFFLFDVVKNPSEEEAEDPESACPDDIAACANLIDHPVFAGIQAEFEEQWASMKQCDDDDGVNYFMSQFFFTDGVLVSPDYGTGTWMPWRDRDSFYPLAMASPADYRPNDAYRRDATRATHSQSVATAAAADEAGSPASSDAAQSQSAHSPQSRQSRRLEEGGLPAASAAHQLLLGAAVGAVGGLLGGFLGASSKYSGVKGQVGGRSGD